MIRIMELEYFVHFDNPQYENLICTAMSDGCTFTFK